MMCGVRVGVQAWPLTSSVGTTGRMRSGSTTAVPEPSATEVTIFTAVHRPLARDRATPWRPRSSTSCTVPG